MPVNFEDATPAMTEKTYRIGQAARMLDLEPYVLRYWESEFPQIQPIRTKKGQRLYSEENIQLLRQIRTLLHDQGMTIDGARKKLVRDAKDTGVSDLKEGIRQELLEIKKLLGSDPK